MIAKSKDVADDIMTSCYREAFKELRSLDCAVNNHIHFHDDDIESEYCQHLRIETNMERILVGTQEIKQSILLYNSILMQHKILWLTL